MKTSKHIKRKHIKRKQVSTKKKENIKNVVVVTVFLNS